MEGRWNDEPSLQNPATGQNELPPEYFGSDTTLTFRSLGDIGITCRACISLNPITPPVASLDNAEL